MIASGGAADGVAVDAPAEAGAESTGIVDAEGAAGEGGAGVDWGLPQAVAMAFTGGSWPAVRSTDTPCPFCTTSTVIASGTTSSIIAFQENAGT